MTVFFFLALITSVKPLQSLYCDTTFCISEAYHIPTRAECVIASVRLVGAWLARDPRHTVFVSCPARYGHEHLLLEMARQLDTKVTFERKDC